MGANVDYFVVGTIVATFLVVGLVVVNVHWPRINLPAALPAASFSLRSLVALLAANLVPLAGVLFLGWSVVDVMVTFWLENLAIGLVNVAKVVRVGGWAALPGVAFFSLHYGMFTVVHLMFIVAIFKNGMLGLPAGSGPAVEFTPFAMVGWAVGTYWLAGLGYLASHTVSFFRNFLGRGEWRQLNIRTAMVLPYGRVAVMHVTILLGAFLVAALHQAAWAVALLVALKVGLDVRSHLAERSPRQLLADAPPPWRRNPSAAPKPFVGPSLAAAVPVLVVAAAAALYVGLRTPGPAPRHAADVRRPDSAERGWERYVDGSIGFTISYPPGFTANPGYAYALAEPSRVIRGVSFNVPAAMASGTNLSADSYVSVESYGGPTCLASDFLPYGTPPFEQRDGDARYLLSVANGAAAGNRYDETLWLLQPAGGEAGCVAIRYYVHSTVLENYPPGTVRAFDGAALEALLGRIRRTYVATPRRQVAVYLYDASRDTDAAGNVACGAAGLAPATRWVGRSGSALADAVSAQLAESLPGVRLVSAELAGGVATLVLDDPFSRSGGGSCRVGILRAQLEAAARQLPQVSEVRILPPEVLQP